MQFDPIITNPGRLTILVALYGKVPLDFVLLRRITGLTDGNLITHARKLASAGFVRIDKHVRLGKKITSITLTDKGHEALRHHLDCLTRALTDPSVLPPQPSSPTPGDDTPEPQPHEQGAWID